jgi:hypothetical protein
MKDTPLWVNDAILFGTAVLVLMYVRATNRLVRSSQHQVESLSLPAIAVWEADHDHLDLINIGNGPAVAIEWRFKDRGTPPVFSESLNPVGALSFLEVHTRRSVGLQQSSLVNRELHCLYRSLSGRRYVSVSTFTEKETFETRFFPTQA